MKKIRKYCIKHITCSEASEYISINVILGFSESFLCHLKEFFVTVVRFASGVMFAKGKSSSELSLSSGSDAILFSILVLDSFFC